MAKPISLFRRLTGKFRLRTKISKDLMTILRIIRVKKGNGAYSEITEKALREYFENHKEELRKYIKMW
ncbi:MAG TPA: hypothetical protein ENI33_06500 [Thermoplasmatales archaeon]|nr:hypothetical protein [Thermoplasmatales archaeon]